MTNSIEYDFADKPIIINGEYFFADGKMTVNYIVHPAEPGVGIPYSYAELDGFSAMEIEVGDHDGTSITKMVVHPGSKIHEQILQNINLGYLEEDCMDNFNNSY